MNIHLPAILMFTRGTRFWHTAISKQNQVEIAIWIAIRVWISLKTQLLIGQRGSATSCSGLFLDEPRICLSGSEENAHDALHISGGIFGQAGFSPCLIKDWRHKTSQHSLWYFNMAMVKMLWKKYQRLCPWISVYFWSLCIFSQGEDQTLHAAFFFGWKDVCCFHCSLSLVESGRFSDSCSHKSKPTNHEKSCGKHTFLDVPRVSFLAPKPYAKIVFFYPRVVFFLNFWSNLSIQMSCGRLTSVSCWNSKMFQGPRDPCPGKTLFMGCCMQELR